MTDKTDKDLNDIDIDNDPLLEAMAFDREYGHLPQKEREKKLLELGLMTQGGHDKNSANLYANLDKP